MDQKTVKTIAYFWGENCSHCKPLKPVLERAKLRFEVESHNTDQPEEMRLALLRGVNGLPTLILSEDGREVERVSGTVAIIKLRAWMGETA